MASRKDDIPVSRAEAVELLMSERRTQLSRRIGGHSGTSSMVLRDEAVASRAAYRGGIAIGQRCLVEPGMPRNTCLSCLSGLPRHSALGLWTLQAGGSSRKAALLAPTTSAFGAGRKRDGGPH